MRAGCAVSTHPLDSEEVEVSIHHEMSDAEKRKAMFNVYAAARRELVKMGVLSD